MRVSEIDFQLPCPPDGGSALKWLADQTKEKFPTGEELVRLVITESNQDFYNCEASGASTGFQRTSVGFHESIDWEKPGLFWYERSWIGLLNRLVRMLAGHI